MSSFTTKLIMEPLDDGCHWRVAEPFTYYLGIESSGLPIIVTVDFVTDLTSVPWGFRWLIPAWGKYGKGAVLHDYLYFVGIFDRVVCDAIFLEAMGTLGVNWLSRFLIYKAVRYFGWIPWLNHRKRMPAKSEVGAAVVKEELSPPVAETIAQEQKELDKDSDKKDQ